jgi:hypothetical protein
MASGPQEGLLCRESKAVTVDKSVSGIETGSSDAFVFLSREQNTALTMKEIAFKSYPRNSFHILLHYFYINAILSVD